MRCVNEGGIHKCERTHENAKKISGRCKALS
jgi:hypothetical protein